MAVDQGTNKEFLDFAAILKLWYRLLSIDNSDFAFELNAVSATSVIRTPEQFDLSTGDAHNQSAKRLIGVISHQDVAANDEHLVYSSDSVSQTQITQPLSTGVRDVIFRMMANLDMRTGDERSLLEKYFVNALSNTTILDRTANSGEESGGSDRGSFPNGLNGVFLLLDPATDHIDIDAVISGMAPSVRHGHLSVNSFDADLTSTLGRDVLDVGKALLFTPDSGTFAGHTFLVADTNGVAGYQAGEDLIWGIVSTPEDLTAITSDIFV